MQDTIYVEKDRKKGKKERRKTWNGNIHIWEQNERNEKETYDHPYILKNSLVNNKRGVE